MNYLSHFYHESPITDPYFACGIILPDLLSDYSKRSGEKIKLHPAKLIEAEDPEMQNLTRGVKQHYNVDKFFHDSKYFIDSTSLINNIIRARPFSCFPKRLFAFSHVFLEIMMDRALLLMDKTICDDLYSMLNRVSEEKFMNYMEMNSVKTPMQPILDHFNLFKKVKFIYNYVNDERLVGLMNRINTGLQNPSFSRSEKMLLTDVIYDTIQFINSEKFPKFPA